MEARQISLSLGILVERTSGTVEFPRTSILKLPTYCSGSGLDNNWLGTKPIGKVRGRCDSRMSECNGNVL